MIILFPVILTLAFGVSFGATAGSQPTTFSVGVVYASAPADGSASSQFTQALSASSVLDVRSYSSNQSAQSALSQGQLQAVLVVPTEFDASVGSYLTHPTQPGLWVNSTLALYLDRASLVSAQVIPSVVQQVLSSAVLGVQQATTPSPVGLTSPSMVEVSPRTVFDTFAPGLFPFASIFLIMMVAQSFTGDKESGMLRRVVTTPTSATEIMTGQVLAYLVVGVVQAVLVLACAYALGYHPATGAAGLALGLLIASVFSVCNVGFGLIAASLSKNAGAATGISFLFLLPQMFLGTFVGSALSSSAAAAGRLVPSYYVTDALTSLFTRGAAVGSPTVILDAVMVALLSVVILAAGILLFRKVGSE